MSSELSYTLQELTDGLDVVIKGNPACRIRGVATIQHAKEGELTFLSNPLYKKYLAQTQASAVVLSETEAADCQANVIISNNPYFTYAKIAERFNNVPTVMPGIHPSAIIQHGANIHPSASIGPQCVIGQGVQIAANVTIGPGCVIGDDVMIGEDTLLDANVTVYHHVILGKRNRLASGVVIGCDGFGFANDRGAWHKVPQLGTVILGDDVDVGANTSIDRGALENTVIGNGVKLDNLIQIGHNTIIGDNTIIAGCVAIAGSTTIGKHCMIGGASCFAGHLTLCDGVIITGMTAVTKSIAEPGIYSSGIVGAVPNLEFRKNNARFYRLENLMQRVKSLETAVNSIVGEEV